MPLFNSNFGSSLLYWASGREFAFFLLPLVCAKASPKSSENLHWACLLCNTMGHSESCRNSVQEFMFSIFWRMWSYRILEDILEDGLRIHVLDILEDVVLSYSGGYS